MANKNIKIKINFFGEKNINQGITVKPSVLHGDLWSGNIGEFIFFLGPQ
jgi:fructosamine-3-kinase